MADIRMTEARISNRSSGITIQLKARRVSDGNAGTALDIELAIEPSQVAFAVQGGRHVATLEVSIWAMSREDEVVGSMTDRIELRLSDDSYAKLVKSSILYSHQVLTGGDATKVRAGVYDYDNDRMGAETVAVRR